MEQEKEIRFNIQLDENHIPEAIHWSASDGNEGGNCDSIVLSIWDSKEKNTLKIDLWTKEMRVDDMNRFYHQMFLSMSDSFVKATGEEAMGQEIRDFAQHFGERMGLLEPR